MVESYYNVKNGCKKWHDCFSCPEEDCHISQNSVRGTRELIQQRNNRLIELFKQGKSPKEAAKKVGISERHARHIRQLTNNKH